MTTLYSDGVYYRANNIVNPFVFETAKKMLPGIVVDFGCGVGTNLCALKMLGWKGYGIDCEKIAVEAAKKKIGEKNIFLSDMVTFDVSLLPKWDLIICNYVLQHLSKSDVITFLKIVSESSRKGNGFVVSFFKNRDGVKLSELFSLMLNNGWKDKRIKEWSRLDTTHGLPHYHEGVESFWIKGD